MLTQQSKVRGDKKDHLWQMTLHLEDCHSYRSVFVCQDCGGSVSTYDERDLNEDPYALIWMEQVDEEPCKRCSELIAGAEPIHDLTFIP